MRQTNASRSVPRATSAAERADAFRHVAEGRLHDAYKLASAILGSPTEARDAVHDAFIIAWQRWPRLRDRDKLDPWFRQIIVNVCRDRLRRSSKQRAVEAEAEPSHVVPDASYQVHNRLMVEEGLRQLRADDTIVLALRYYRDLKVDDIAEVLGVPPGTVKSRLNHAHNRLRAVLELEQGGGPR